MLEQAESTFKLHGHNSTAAPLASYNGLGAPGQWSNWRAKGSFLKNEVAYIILVTFLSVRMPPKSRRKGDAKASFLGKDSKFYETKTLGTADREEKGRKSSKSVFCALKTPCIISEAYPQQKCNTNVLHQNKQVMPDFMVLRGFDLRSNLGKNPSLIL